jgi:hypothetical protein
MKLTTDLDTVCLMMMMLELKSRDDQMQQMQGLRFEARDDAAFSVVSDIPYHQKLFWW